MSNEYGDECRTVGEIVNACQPILGGHPPEIQGAAIADMLSIFITAHAPYLRDRILKQIIETAVNMIPANEHMLFEDGIHPYERGGEEGQ